MSRSTLRIAHLSDLHFCARSEAIFESILKLLVLVGLGSLVSRIIRGLPPRAKLPALAAAIGVALLGAALSRRARRLLSFIHDLLFVAMKADPGRLDAIMEALDRYEIDHLVISGDITTTSRASEFSKARDFLARHGWSGSRMTVVPGNHDRLDESEPALFETYFGKRRLLRRLAPGVWLAAIDSTRKPGQERGFKDVILANTGGVISGNTISRLAGRLADFDDSILLLAVHHPVLKIAERKTNDLLRGIYRDFRGPAEGSEQLLELLVEHSPQVLCGHVHPARKITRRRSGAAVHCMVAASLPNSRVGFNLVEVSRGREVRTRFVPA